MVSDRGFDLKDGAFLRQTSVLHLVSLAPSCIKIGGIVRQGWGTKVMKDRSSYEVCKNEM